MNAVMFDERTEDLRAAWPPDLVRVFEVDPDLVQDLDEQTAAHLSRRTIASVVWLDDGIWSPEDRFGPEPRPGWLGLLVIDGLLTRSVRTGGRQCRELLGAGDLLLPWQEDDSGAAVDWKVLTPTRLAILDDRFAAVAGRWPAVFARLLERFAMRSRSLAFTLTLANVRRAEVRLELLLSHLAQRWGRVTPDGIVLQLPLTHALLGHLACMRRPTATTALHRLMDDGRLHRRADGTWVLPRRALSA